MNFFEELKNYDTEVASACENELQRQRHNIELRNHSHARNVVGSHIVVAAGRKAGMKVKIVINLFNPGIGWKHVSFVKAIK